jgi:hypothetical protein
MRTFYTIISIVPNALVSDSLSIGLVLSNDEKFFVKFSDTKIRLAKSLLGDNNNILDFFISHIKEVLSLVESDNSSDSLELFEPVKPINANYFSYLSRYNNNIIQYQDPVFIKDESNSETLSKLFKLMIDKSESDLIINARTNSFAQTKKIIEERLINRVKDKVHTNIKLSSNNLPNLYFNYEMDCVGLNGVITGAKSIDFNRTDLPIQKDVSNYYAITNMMENLYSKSNKRNNYYIITEEPENIQSDEHDLWEKVIKLPKFIPIHPEQSDIVAAIIEETKAGKFLKTI